MGNLDFMNFFFYLQRLKQSLKPTREWGPALNQDRKDAGYRPLPKYEKEHPDVRNRIKEGNSYSPIMNSSAV